MSRAIPTTLIAAALLASACKKDEPAAESTPTKTTAAAAMPAASAKGAHEGHEMPSAAAVEYKALTGDGKVFFDGTKDGDTLKGPEKDGKVSVNVKMGVEGATIKPAGALEPNTGHHHIIIDGKGGAEGTVVPADETHLHFGKGQTEATLELTPGEHTLTLQLADGFHRSYGEAWSATVKVNVAAGT